MVKTVMGVSQEERKRIVKAAIHSNVLEGHEYTEEEKAFYQMYIDGEKTLDELEAEFLKSFKKEIK